MHGKNDISRIIEVYDNAVIRAYVKIRFHILRQRFLHEIGQYLPARGDVLDIGCGFGLFSLFFAMQRPEGRFHGIDLNAKRIESARRAAGKLGLSNIDFKTESAVNLTLEKPYDAIYMLDIVHHIPPEAVAPLLASITGSLAPGGILLIKDIDSKPAYKRWFTWWLDKLMDYKTPVSYWPAEKLIHLLEGYGFTVHMHHMIDYLPYPHILYICRKQAA